MSQKLSFLTYNWWLVDDNCWYHFDVKSTFLPNGLSVVQNASEMITLVTSSGCLGSYKLQPASACPEPLNHNIYDSIRHALGYCRALVCQLILISPGCQILVRVPACAFYITASQQIYKSPCYEQEQTTWYTNYVSVSTQTIWLQQSGEIDSRNFIFYEKIVGIYN